MLNSAWVCPVGTLCMIWKQLKCIQCCALHCKGCKWYRSAPLPCCSLMFYSLWSHAGTTPNELMITWLSACWMINEQWENQSDQVLRGILHLWNTDSWGATVTREKSTSARRAVAPVAATTINLMGLHMALQNQWKIIADSSRHLRLPGEQESLNLYWNSTETSRKEMVTIYVQ